MKIETLPIDKKYPYLAMDDRLNYYIVISPQTSIILGNYNQNMLSVVRQGTFNLTPTLDDYRLIVDSYIKNNEISIIVSHPAALPHKPFTLYNFAKNDFDFFTWDEISSQYEVIYQQILISND
jgi:hypothetical protein